ncbi:MAG: EthD domain-containing protein [Bryobacteraceae bacterium]|nr:EthD domain-containing protein [Bryobacteraceae bacterium]
MQNYAVRDQDGRVVFYVLLWKRKGISLQLFDDYWRNVHGPVCARLPGQYQYWQLHVAHNEGGVWPQLPGIAYSTPEAQNFDGIAELTFQSEEDRTTWFQAAAILMDDEHNLFSKAIGYNTGTGNSITFVDGIPTGDPNGAPGVEKYHVMVRKTDGISVADFRKYLRDTFAPAVAGSENVLKFRLHMFEEVDATRPEAAGVAHAEPYEDSYQAAFEIAFTNRLEQEKFFASDAYATAVADQAKYIKQIFPFPERSAYALVYGGKMTLAGQRSSTVAELITSIGATNQLRDDITSLMLGGGSAVGAGA